MIYDSIIIGGGPAGVAAGVYVARKKMKSLMLVKELNGQSVVSDDIQNWIGDNHITGIDLANKLAAHVKAYPEVLEVREGESVMSVRVIECTENRECDYEVTTDKGVYTAKSIIVCSGARRRKLGVPGEEQFNGKGVAYCSTCDAPLFKDKVVAVVGGGNAGLEAVGDLLPYANKVFLLERGDKPRGDATTYEEILQSDKVTMITRAKVKEILGEKFVTGLVYTDASGSEQKLDVQGVFVEIGSVPNSELVKDVVELDKHGQIMIDAKYASTSKPGVFAAGDVTDDSFKQNNISAGDGVRAALSAYAYVQNRQKANPAHEPVE